MQYKVVDYSRMFKYPKIAFFPLQEFLDKSPEVKKKLNDGYFVMIMSVRDLGEKFDRSAIADYIASDYDYEKNACMIGYLHSSHYDFYTVMDHYRIIASKDEERIIHPPIVEKIKERMPTPVRNMWVFEADA